MVEKKLEKRKIFTSTDGEQLVLQLYTFCSQDHIKARFEQYKPVMGDKEVIHCVYLQYYEVVEE